MKAINSVFFDPEKFSLRTRSLRSVRGLVEVTGWTELGRLGVTRPTKSGSMLDPAHQISKKKLLSSGTIVQL